MYIHMQLAMQPTSANKTVCSHTISKKKNNLEISIEAEQFDRFNAIIVWQT